MPAKIKTTLTRLRERVAEFTLPQKTIAVLAVAILIAAVALAVSFATRTTYTPMFSGLSGQDASAVVEQLESEGVPYQLANGGSTILVPEEHVHDQRITAAANGLPGDSSGGYSLLDEMSVTSSKFQQDVTYKRAIEGELSATIGDMNGVESATVQIAVPEKTVFADTERTPTASVYLKAANGHTITNEQVEAIIHLTSAAVDGMAPTDVAVIDSTGKVLSQVGLGTMNPDTQATDYEKAVAAQVQTMLDQVVGTGNATVAVKAEVDTSSSEELTEEFNTPENGPVLNEQTKTEAYEGAGGREAGVLGPDNIAVPDGNTGESTFNSEETSRNNAINKTTRTTVVPAGRLVRQTVSVALDSQAAAPMNQGAISDLVAAAAGINTERGDLVQVEVLPFNTDSAEAAAAALAEAEEAAAAAERAKTLRNAAIAGAVLLLAVLLLIARANRKRRERREALDLGELGILEAGESTVELDEVPEPELLDVADEPPVIEPPKSRHNDIDQRRAEIDALAATDPQKTVDYLRVMLQSDKLGAGSR